MCVSLRPGLNVMPFDYDYSLEAGKKLREVYEKEQQEFKRMKSLGYRWKNSKWQKEHE